MVKEDVVKSVTIEHIIDIADFIKEDIDKFGIVIVAIVCDTHTGGLRAISIENYTKSYDAYFIGSLNYSYKENVTVEEIRKDLRLLIGLDI